MYSSSSLYFELDFTVLDIRNKRKRRSEESSSLFFGGGGRKTAGPSPFMNQTKTKQTNKLHQCIIILGREFSVSTPSKKKKKKDRRGRAKEKTFEDRIRRSDPECGVRVFMRTRRMR
jgi:hypothetical protein